jgi:spermidine synthase
MALVLFAAHPARWWRTTRARQWLLFAACAALLLLAGDPYRRLTIDRAEALWPGRTVVYSHHEEAAGATTAFGEQGSELGKQLWVNGHGMTELETVTKLMAHLPIWLADDPHEALVICFGMGTTVRSASRHEALQVTAVELVPHVIECFRYFHADGPAVLSQANVRAVTDDGRNYLLMHAKQYDVITVDPAPPLYSAGTVNLYSRNFFQLCRDRLRPGGVMCLWIPPGSSSEVKMIMRTYLEVFEHVGFWSGTARYPGFLLLGSRQPRAGTLDRFRAGLQREAVRNDLLEWSSDLHSPEKLQALFLANGDELRDWLCDSPVITDDRPYTEFPLARAVLKPDEFRTWLTAEELRAYLNSRGRPHAGPSTTPP